MRAEVPSELNENLEVRQQREAGLFLGRGHLPCWLAGIPSLVCRVKHVVVVEDLVLVQSPKVDDLVPIFYRVMEGPGFRHLAPFLVYQAYRLRAGVNDVDFVLVIAGHPPAAKDVEVFSYGGHREALDPLELVRELVLSEVHSAEIAGRVSVAARHNVNYVVFRVELIVNGGEGLVVDPLVSDDEFVLI